MIKFYLIADCDKVKCILYTVKQPIQKEKRYSSQANRRDKIGSQKIIQIFKAEKEAKGNKKMNQ